MTCTHLLGLIILRRSKDQRILNSKADFLEESAFGFYTILAITSQLIKLFFKPVV